MYFKLLYRPHRASNHGFSVVAVQYIVRMFGRILGFCPVYSSSTCQLWQSKMCLDIAKYALGGKFTLLRTETYFLLFSSHYVIWYWQYHLLCDVCVCVLHAYLRPGLRLYHHLPKFYWFPQTFKIITAQQYICLNVIF